MGSKIGLVIGLWLGMGALVAQTTDSLKHQDLSLEDAVVEEEIIFGSFVETMALFPGCMNDTTSYEAAKTCSDQALMTFVYNNLSYPNSIIEDPLQSRVIVAFTITAEGKLINPKIVYGINAALGEAALEVVYLLQKLPDPWTPGKQRGQPVAQQYNLPIHLHYRR